MAFEIPSLPLPFVGTGKEKGKKMEPFSLPPLPYSYGSLRAAIDSKTMKIHHRRHHAKYISKLNAALKDYPEWGEQSIETILMSLEQVPETIRTAVRNNGGGHANHSLFWQVMSPKGRQYPRGELAEAIRDTFGGLSEMKQEFAKAATSLFGSGWTWLVLYAGRLSIMSTPNQDSPVSQGYRPILGLDLWEHAYYLRYQNQRPDYVSAWWKVVNWKNVEERYEEGMQV
jgi:Fe-Mn family superoxide dismutase